jgi:hypothetical protein
MDATMRVPVTVFVVIVRDLNVFVVVVRDLSDFAVVGRDATLVFIVNLVSIEVTAITLKSRLPLTNLPY